MNPVKVRSQESGVRSQTPISAPLAALLAAAILAVGGCGKPPGSFKSNEPTGGPKGDPWAAAANRLRKDTDPAACKAALVALAADLGRAEKADKPAPPPPDAEAALAKLVPLNDQDREEVRSASYTPHDAAYLAECMFLRDAARSLAVQGAPPEPLADLAFAWVCRQVYLDPWLIEVQPGARMGTALPPASVLRRGHGSGLERMYVFLALLQQMGLDGCLVGPPDAGDKPAGFVAYSPDKRTVLTGTPRGPLWAVGVRVGNDVRVYDPWRGVVFPARLNDLKANPEAHKAWFDDPANVSGVTPDEAKKATVFLAVPVNALAPRTALLEEKLRADVGVKLAVNPAALRDAFPDPKPAFWNPPADQFAYGRAARTFLPPEEGGTDRSDPANRLHTAYLRAQLPPVDRILPADLLRVPEVRQDVGGRIGQLAQSTYAAAFLDPPTPRERIQRGQFQDAARALVGRQDEFNKASQRYRNTPDADRQVREWLEKAEQIYKSFHRDAGARAAIDEHWRTQGAALLMDRAISEVGQAEAAFLLALCKHEQAERLQARLDRATGAEADRLKVEAAAAWADAAGQWRSYREQQGAAQAGLPGRAEHVRSLTARAETLARRN